MFDNTGLHGEFTCVSPSEMLLLLFLSLIPVCLCRQVRHGTVTTLTSAHLISLTFHTKAQKTILDPDE